MFAREPDPNGSPGADLAAGLPTPTFLPRRYKPRNVGEWSGHLAFASDLIAARQPGLIVELGTHWGEAYFTFCQTVQEHGLSSLCYAVDHWLGDEHAGLYGEEVFEEVSQYNARFYRQFSYLLRRSFDEALSQFSDGSIGLLHIDGLHTYEAVTHDFRSWLPKVSAGGIVLLHDIVPRHQDFGVWRLWDDIRREFPDTFEFHHSWGLGVVRKEGAAGSTRLERLLFESSPAVQEDVRRHYAVYASHLEHILGRMPLIPAPPPPLPEINVQVFPCIDGVYSPETSQIRKTRSYTWSTLQFDLRDANMNGPLRIDPGSEPSFIEIGDVLVHSRETGELLWSSPAAAAERGFQIGGTALAHSDDRSLLINPGDDPLVLLSSAPDLRGPLKLTITLRVTPVSTPAMAMVRDHLQAAWEKLAIARREQEAAAAQLRAMEAQHNQALAEKRNLEAEVSHLRGSLEQLQSSASWRVTSPMRRLMAALRSEKAR